MWETFSKTFNLLGLGNALYRFAPVEISEAKSVNLPLQENVSLQNDMFAPCLHPHNIPKNIF